MRTGIVTVLAIMLGIVLAFWLFGLSFTRSIEALKSAAIVPLFVGLIASVLLTGFSRSAAVAVVSGLAIPTIVLGTFVFVSVIREGKGAEWTHLLIPAALTSAVVAGSLAARVARRRSPLR